MFYRLGSLLSLANLEGFFLVEKSEDSDAGQIIECRQFVPGRGLDSYRYRFASHAISVERCQDFDIEANLRRVGLIK